jgi:hypothetical protein
LQFFQKLLNKDLISPYAKLSKYTENVMKNPGFLKSVPENFEETILAALKKRNHPLTL